MIPVSLTGEGPDLEEVENLVKSDNSIRGIWCVPKYSNPTGEVYSQKTINGLDLDIGNNDRCWWLSKTIQ